MKYEEQTCDCIGQAWRESQERTKGNSEQIERQEGRKAEDQEEWKTIRDYHGRYEVSNIGRVRSLSRSETKRDGKSLFIKERILKPGKTFKGYLMVGISSNDFKRETMTVHKLVCETFIGERPVGHEIDHINGIKTDNRVENLRYVTRGQNQINHDKIRGIFKCPDGRFETHIEVNQMKRYLGRYKTYEEAVTVRLAEEERIFPGINKRRKEGYRAGFDAGKMKGKK